MGMEIIFVALLVLLLFGGKRMPEFLRELGKLMHGLQRARQELADAIRREADGVSAAMEHRPAPENGAEATALQRPNDPSIEPEPATESGAQTHEGEIPPEYAGYASPPAEASIEDDGDGCGDPSRQDTSRSATAAGRGAVPDHAA